MTNDQNWKLMLAFIFIWTFTIAGTVLACGYLDRLTTLEVEAMRAGLVQDDSGNWVKIQD
jgi:hypothetical protein